MANIKRWRTRSLVAALVALYTVPALASDAPPDFDPSEPIVVEKSKHGKAVPDQATMQSVFESQFGVIDQCVLDHKDRMGDDAQLIGDAINSVLLDPDGGPPTAVHAELPQKYANHEKLVTCLRVATAAASYPAFDGAPAVVHFEYELDPGFIDCAPDDDRPECE